MPVLIKRTFSVEKEKELVERSASGRDKLTKPKHFVPPQQ